MVSPIKNDYEKEKIMPTASGGIAGYFLCRMRGSQPGNSLDPFKRIHIKPIA
jgi:hypothetical protein